MAEKQMGVKELAAKLSCEPHTVTAWRKGRFSPDRENAFALERITEGRVRAADWGAT